MCIIGVVSFYLAFWFLSLVMNSCIRGLFANFFGAAIIWQGFICMIMYLIFMQTVSTVYQNMDDIYDDLFNKDKKVEESK